MTGSSLALTLATTLLGLIGTYYFYRRSIRSPKPIYGVARIPLIGGISPLLPSEVKVSYGDQSVSSLVKSYIFFWNRGTETLNASDIAEPDPIRLVLVDDPVGDDSTSEFSPEPEILRTRVIRVTRDVNCASVEQDRCVSKTEARIDFSFLDPGDGVIIEVLHTGDDSEIILKGTVKGIPKGLSFKGRVTAPGILNDTPGIFVNSPPAPPKIISRSLIAIGVLVALFLLSAPLLPTSVIMAGNFNNPTVTRVLYFGAGIILVCVMATEFYRRNRLPKSLRNFQLTDLVE